MNCVNFSLAHVSWQGNNQECYKKVIALFISKCYIKHPVVQLSWKKAYDRFNRIAAERCDAARHNELSSGNLESSSL